jgi:hypothetical protein
MPKDINDINTPEELGEWMKEMAKNYPPPPKNIPTIEIGEEKAAGKRPEIFDFIEDLRK